MSVATFGAADHPGHPTMIETARLVRDLAEWNSNGDTQTLSIPIVVKAPAKLPGHRVADQRAAEPVCGWRLAVGVRRVMAKHRRRHVGRPAAERLGLGQCAPLCEEVTMRSFAFYACISRGSTPPSDTAELRSELAISNHRPRALGSKPRE